MATRCTPPSAGADGGSGDHFNAKHAARCMTALSADVAAGGAVDVDAAIMLARLIAQDAALSANALIGLPPAAIERLGNAVLALVDGVAHDAHMAAKVFLRASDALWIRLPRQASDTVACAIAKSAHWSKHALISMPQRVLTLTDDLRHALAVGAAMTAETAAETLIKVDTAVWSVLQDDDKAALIRSAASDPPWAAHVVLRMAIGRWLALGEAHRMSLVAAIEERPSAAKVAFLMSDDRWNTLTPSMIAILARTASRDAAIARAALESVFPHRMNAIAPEDQEALVLAAMGQNPGFALRWLSRLGVDRLRALAPRAQCAIGRCIAQRSECAAEAIVGVSPDRWQGLHNDARRLLVDGAATSPTHSAWTLQRLHAERRRLLSRDDIETLIRASARSADAAEAVLCMYQTYRDVMSPTLTDDLIDALRHTPKRAANVATWAIQTGTALDASIWERLMETASGDPAAILVVLSHMKSRTVECTSERAWHAIVTAISGSPDHAFEAVIGMDRRAWASVPSTFRLKIITAACAQVRYADVLLALPREWTPDVIERIVELRDRARAEEERRGRLTC
jgi:hypothetical protein